MERLGGSKNNELELHGQHHEDNSDVNDIKAQPLKQEDIYLLLCKAGADRAEVDKDQVALEVGDVIERSGVAGSTLAAMAVPPLEFTESMYDVPLKNRQLMNRRCGGITQPRSKQTHTENTCRPRPRRQTSEAGLSTAVHESQAKN
jgi:hypothetical protein